MSSRQTLLQELARIGAPLTGEELLLAGGRGPEQPCIKGPIAYPLEVGSDWPSTRCEPTELMGLAPSDLAILSLMSGATIADSDLHCERVDEVLATAILANEVAGAIRLQVTHKRVFFNLFTVTTLQAACCGAAPRWPLGSLESTLMPHAERGPTRVSDTVSEWLGTTSTDPRRLALLRVMDGMAARGLLHREVSQRRVLRIFTARSTHYTPADRPAALAVPRSAMQFEEQCRQARPELLELLMREIRIGFDRRTLSG